MRPLACDRSRAWTSLRLDDELSKFEHVLLGAHLALCRDCRRFADDLEWQTQALRSASLEQMSYPVAIPARRTWRWPALGLSTGAVAASIFALTVGLRGASPQGPASPLSTARPAQRAEKLSNQQTSDVQTVQMPGGIAFRGDRLANP